MQLSPRQGRSQYSKVIYMLRYHSNEGTPPHRGARRAGQDLRAPEKLPASASNAAPHIQAKVIGSIGRVGRDVRITLDNTEVPPYPTTTPRGRANPTLDWSLNIYIYMVARTRCLCSANQRVDGRGRLSRFHGVPSTDAKRSSVSERKRRRWRTRRDSNSRPSGSKRNPGLHAVQTRQLNASKQR
jgi:hypothetical protein